MEVDLAFLYQNNEKIGQISLSVSGVCIESARFVTLTSIGSLEKWTKLANMRMSIILPDS